MESLLGSFDERLTAFRQSDQNRERYIIDLFDSLQRLKLEHDRLQDDYENERESRRRIQTIQREKSSELQALRRSIENSAYTVTIIDGDGAPFVDTLVQQGNVGGVEAASRLAAAIKDHIAELYPDEGSDWRSVVQIYLNLDGLSRKLYACDIVNSYTFADFIRDFNSTSPLINIIDVGQGKERADHKVRENFNFHLGSPACKHIIFGGCHDKGYLNILREHQYTKAATSRISLLSTFTDVQAISETANFNHIKFPNVFRSTPLPDRPTRQITPPPAVALPRTQTNGTATPSLAAPTPAALPAVSPTVRKVAPVSDVASPGAERPTIRERKNSNMKSTDITPSTNGAATNGSYAIVGGTTSANQSFSIVSNKKKQAADSRPCYYVNRDQTRIDLPLKFQKEDLLTVKAKAEKNGKNFCTPLVVFGQCDNKYCKFNHSVGELSQAEKGAIKLLGRNLPCSNRNGCEEVKCHYGHVCPHENCTQRAKCRFAEDQHNVDLRAYRRVFEDGSMQAC